MRLPRSVADDAKPAPGRRPPGSWMLPLFAQWPVRALVVAALLVGAAGLMLSLRGTAGNDPTVSSQLQSLLRQGGPLVVYSEFGPEADTLWAANADDPADRVQLGRVDHAENFGIFPSLSPDGTRIAYTVLLPVPGPSGAAELWVLEIAGGASRRLADGIDLRVTPVWSPASDAVVVRRSDGQEGSAGSSELLRIDLNGTATTIASAEAGLFPIDFSPDGAWLYYAILSPSGTDLARAPAQSSGKAEVVAHLSDGIARDWHLSPDGTQLAYLGQVSLEGGFTFVAQVLDLALGTVYTPLSRGSAQFNPIWERGGGLTIGRLDGDAGGAPVRLSVDGNVLARVPPPGSPSGRAGFDVPLSWSPDGAYLAVRSFERSSVANPGPSRVVVTGADGQRRELSPVSDVVVAGWLEVSP
ncbi:MAG: PD40 domain-containing protein [Chloroflexi bacterium]|nr:PD40 domain-containing protein [Chloroflexota bacterium]